MGCGQPEAPLGGRRGGVVDGEHAADGLMLEPLAGVALGAGRARGEFGGGQAVLGVGQCPVPAQPVAQVGGLGQLGTERGGEQLLDEGLGRFGSGCGGLGVDCGHGIPPGVMAQGRVRRQSVTGIHGSER